MTLPMSLAANHDDAGRSNGVLRGCREERGWSLNRAAFELHRMAQEAGIPMTASVESVRRALMRHEDGQSSPKRADDPYAQLYSLAYRRRPEELFGNLRPSISGDGTFLVHAHQFVPVFVGAAVDELASALSAVPVTVGWADAQRVELVLDEDGEPPVRGLLYLFSWGVAVWHMVTPHRADAIADVSVWRRESHRFVRQRLAAHLSRLLDHERACARYVLTAFWLVEPAWSGRDLHTALRLLTSPRALLGSGDGDHHHARQIEQRLFNDGFAPEDHVPIGVDGVSLGWASWAGVAYHPLAPAAALTEDDLASVELLAQGLWCLCEELEQQIRDGEDPKLPAGHDWRWLRGRRAAIVRGDANEPAQLRALRAAVVSSSELDQKLIETVQLLKEEAP
ncbi:hypothetical protein [Amycolatopsis sp. cg9]|uniref:hypothetical protein n=1 Tax=Amycolatopsis sp. cg9 TaxID=3238801 RepID=UPI003523A829